MNQTFIRCLDNELKTAALKKHANHIQTPREPEMPLKALVDNIDQMDLTRTVTNNHKRLYEVNQTTTNISEDLKQMNIACNNMNDLNQNDLDQFEGTICNLLNGIINTYDRKNFKGRPKFALFCSYCISHGHSQGRCFKRPRRESIARPKERSFYSHMRNNQNLPNRRIDSNNINGRQLPSTSPVYHNSRSRTPYRSQSGNNPNNNSYSRDNRYYQGHRNSNNNYNNGSGSYNRNNYNEAELTVTTETKIITNTTIADRIQDTQTAVNHDNIHHTTEILMITVIMIDKDIIVKIQTKVTDTDNDQVVTIDIILIIIIIIIGMTEDTQRKENKMIDIIQRIEEQTEINTTITIKTE